MNMINKVVTPVSHTITALDGDRTGTRIVITNTSNRPILDLVVLGNTNTDTKIPQHPFSSSVECLEAGKTYEIKIFHENAGIVRLDGIMGQVEGAETRFCIKSAPAKMPKIIAVKEDTGRSQWPSSARPKHRTRGSGVCITMGVAF